MVFLLSALYRALVLIISIVAYNLAYSLVNVVRTEVIGYKVKESNSDA